jgi:hypothetical protein
MPKRSQYNFLSALFLQIQLRLWQMAPQWISQQTRQQLSSQMASHWIRISGLWVVIELYFLPQTNLIKSE